MEAWRVKCIFRVRSLRCPFNSNGHSRASRRGRDSKYGLALFIFTPIADEKALGAHSHSTHRNMMKQLLTLLLAFFVMTPQLAARSFEYEGLWYTVLDEEAKTCETRAGSSNSAGNNIASGYSCQIPSIVSDGNSDYTVIAIGDYAFYEAID